MLVLDGFLLWDSVQGAFAPFLLSLVAVAAVAGAAERLAGRTVALLAAAVFFAQPLMLWEATSTFIESGLACAVALAGWNLLRFARHGERRSLVLAGLFAGGAAGMKYLGLIAVLALTVAAAIALHRRLTLARVLAFAAPGRPGRASLVREERDPDRQPGVSAPLRWPERLGGGGARRDDGLVRRGPLRRRLPPHARPPARGR